MVFWPFSVILSEAVGGGGENNNRFLWIGVFILCVGVFVCSSPIFDEGLEVEGESHAERQQRGVFLQHFGQNLKVCLAVLVGKLPCSQLHLAHTRWHRPSSALVRLINCITFIFLKFHLWHYPNRVHNNFEVNLELIYLFLIRNTSKFIVASEQFVFKWENSEIRAFCCTLFSPANKNERE